jgi:hypothetical protein
LEQLEEVAEQLEEVAEQLEEELHHKNKKMTQLTPNQLERLSRISNPIIRRRFGMFYQLPKDIQDSMFSEETSGRIWKMTKEKYNLPNKDISSVALIIGLILLGELPIKNFIVALQDDLDIDLKTAQAIAQEINVAIFQPIRESLMFVHNIGGKTNISDANLRTSTTGGQVYANDTNRDQIPNNTRTGGNEQGTVNRGQVQNYNAQIPNRTQYSGQRTDNRMQIPNQQTPVRDTYREGNQMPKANDSQQPNLKDEYYDYEIQRKREEIINRNKIRTQQQTPPLPNNNQARPAMLRMLPKKNIVDLRLAKKKYKKNQYDGFFSA